MSQPETKLQLLKMKISISHFYLMHGYLYFHKPFPGRSLCLLLFGHVIFDSERQIQNTHIEKESINLTYTNKYSTFYEENNFPAPKYLKAYNSALLRTVSIAPDLGPLKELTY